MGYQREASSTSNPDVLRPTMKEKDKKESWVGRNLKRLSLDVVSGLGSDKKASASTTDLSMRLPEPDHKLQRRSFEDQAQLVGGRRGIPESMTGKR